MGQQGFLRPAFQLGFLHFSWHGPSRTIVACQDWVWPISTAQPKARSGTNAMCLRAKGEIDRRQVSCGNLAVDSHGEGWRHEQVGACVSLRRFDMKSLTRYNR